VYIFEDISSIKMSAGTCCVQFVRVLVIIFNIVFIFCGLALIGLGAWIFADPRVLHVIDLTVDATNSHLLRDAAILLISMGCLLFVVSLLGLVGAILENSVLLGIYLALLIIAFCGEIAGAVMAIAFKDWFLDQLRDVLRDSLVNNPYYETPPDSSTCKASDVGALWDYIQVRMDCCGVDSAPQTGYESVQYSFYQNCPALKPGFNKPLTCCVHDSELQPIDTLNETKSADKFHCPDLKPTGCWNEMEWWVGHYSPVLIGIGFGVAMLQTIGIIFAACLCVNSRSRWKGYKKQS
jgi:hypothetical protein